MEKVFADLGVTRESVGNVVDNAQKFIDYAECIRVRILSYFFQKSFSQLLEDIKCPVLERRNADYVMKDPSAPITQSQYLTDENSSLYNLNDGDEHE